jgi:ribosome maturation factor RimP
MTEHDELRKVADGLAAAQGNYILEFSIRRSRGQAVIDIVLDSYEAGVTIGHCAAFNKELCRAIDEQKMLGCDYSVQVASPGLDRPLRQPHEFRRRLDKEVRLHLNCEIQGKKEYQGLVRAVSEDTLELEIKKEIVRIPLAAIHLGKQVL